MIKHLKLENIGPAPSLEVEEFGSRLNLFTGDNGLGKTFLLDACWYALTSTWAGGSEEQFYPQSELSKNEVPAIEYVIVGQMGPYARNRSQYQFREQSWSRRPARPNMPGLVIYARIDGGFSVWDPARNYWPDQENDGVRDRPDAYQFSKDQVWDGLEEADGKQKRIICNGLLRDVESWRARRNGYFALLSGVLEGLSEDKANPLRFGQGVRVKLQDVRDIPTLELPYGNVPVTQTAAGMRRVLGLAYLLVWAWEEHVRAAQLQKEAPTRRIVLLFDEVEAHLHPKWQRVFLPALVNIIDGLVLKGQVEAITGDPTLSVEQKAESVLKKIPRSVQIIATTHAPLVLASVETLWREDMDKLFIFDLNREASSSKPRVTLNPSKWVLRGDASAWLRSPLFGLPQARSKEAEKAIETAEKWMRHDRSALPSGLDSSDKIHHRLIEVLPEFDPFWPRWIVKRKGRE